MTPEQVDAILPQSWPPAARNEVAELVLLAPETEIGRLVASAVKLGWWLCEKHRPALALAVPAPAVPVAAGDPAMEGWE